MSTQLSAARSRIPRIAEAAVERARLTVVPRAASRAGRTPFVALISLLLVAGVAGLLWFNTNMQQTSFKVTALEQRAETLNAEQQGLQMDLDALRNPQRVALQAKRMGMVPVEAPAFIRLGDGKVLGTPMPATGQDSIRLDGLPTKRPAALRPRPLVIRLNKAVKGGAAAADAATATGTKKSR